MSISKKDFSKQSKILKTGCDLRNFPNVKYVNCIPALPYLARRKVAHSVGDLPGKLHHLLWRQICLRFYIRVLKVRVLKAPTLPQETQKITIRNVLNKHK